MSVLYQGNRYSKLAARDQRALERAEYIASDAVIAIYDEILARLPAHLREKAAVVALVGVHSGIARLIASTSPNPAITAKHAADLLVHETNFWRLQK